MTETGGTDFLKAAVAAFPPSSRPLAEDAAGILMRTSILFDENRPVMRVLRSNATSYRDCYYRRAYPDRRSYPGLAFLSRLELWAS